MSKAIKLDDQVYERLDRLRGKRETFSEVVARLLEIVEVVHKSAEILGPSHWVNERPATDATAKEMVDRRGDRPALPHVPVH